MGGSVGSIFETVTKPASIVGNVLGQVPVVGPVLGPAANIAMGGNPFTAIAGGIGNALTGGFESGGGGGGGGGGGSSGSPTAPPGAGGTATPTYASPGFNYGANTYTYGDKPYDASKYFIEGNKGVYNILPQLGSLYGDNSLQQRAGAPSANIYNDIIGQFSQNQDSLAQQNFQKNFGLQTYNPNTASPTTLASDFTAPDYLKSDIQNALGEYYPSGSTQTDSIPVNYADFGFGADDTLTKLASYAKTQNNPFFVPFSSADVRPEPEPYRAPTVMPVSSNPQVAQPLRYAPSQDARGPAPRDLAPASVASSGSFRPAETGSTTARTAAPAAPGMFKPVNIRTGGLASLRRK
jgi:hypothetical protein